MQIIQRSDDITLRYSEDKKKYYVFIGEEKWYGHKYMSIVYKEFCIMKRQRSLNLELAM